MKPANEILLRYLVMVIIAVVSLTVPVFYVIFRPLTVWPTAWMLQLFYNVSVSDINMMVNGHGIAIIDACIAGSAFLLLLLLNLLTREISLKKRIFIFVVDAIVLLILNIIRLVILIALSVNNSIFFDFTHKLFWYVLSTGFVVIIWIASVKIFKLKKIPFFSDLAFLLKAKNRQNKRID